MPYEYPVLLESVGEKIAQQLVTKGLSQEGASDVAFAMTEFLRKEWGGQRIYLPQSEYLELNERNIRILQRLRDGESYQEIAMDLHLSEERIRQIERASRLARSQKVDSPALPFGDRSA